MKAIGRQPRFRMLWLLACSLVAVPAHGQNNGPLPASRELNNSAPPHEPNRGIRVDVDLALVNVTVTDPFNRLVTGLEKENFR
ncbi:MAG TPA: hypothetical protein VKE24_02145, partial [Candidatus Acidoferrales bacterium]|nr:hypothetical protein [Candidatus Acidoferrales bacterium]